MQSYNLRAMKFGVHSSCKLKFKGREALTTLCNWRQNVWANTIMLIGSLNSYLALNITK